MIEAVQYSLVIIHWAGTDAGDDPNGNVKLTVIEVG
jgi:hypothetical protein